MPATDDQNVVVVESAHETIISGEGDEAKALVAINGAWDMI